MTNKDNLYEVKGPKNLYEMTAAEFENAVKETDLIVLSCGAVENHGSHLPMGADTYQGDYLIKRTTEKLEEMGIKAVPGLTIPFGVETNTFERADILGNCSLSQNTFILVLKEIIINLNKHGFKKFVICMSHAENWAAMNVAAKDLADENNIESLVVNWIPPMNEEWPKILKNTKHQGHGGEDETSCVMAAVPKLVNTKGIKPWYPEETGPYVKDSGLYYYGGAVGIFKPVGSDKSPGYIGDPAVATAEAGEACFNVYAEWIADVTKKYFFPKIK